MVALQGVAIMESRIAKAVGLQQTPVAILLADERPANPVPFKKGEWGCVMFMFANAARQLTMKPPIQEGESQWSVPLTPLRWCEGNGEGGILD